MRLRPSRLFTRAKKTREERDVALLAFFFPGRFRFLKRTPRPLSARRAFSGSYVRCLDRFTIPSRRYTPGTSSAGTTGATPRTAVLAPSPSSPAPRPRSRFAGARASRGPCRASLEPRIGNTRRFAKPREPRRERQLSFFRFFRLAFYVLELKRLLRPDPSRFANAPASAVLSIRAGVDARVAREPVTKDARRRTGGVRATRDASSSRKQREKIHVGTLVIAKRMCLCPEHARRSRGWMITVSRVSSRRRSGRWWFAR